MAECVKKLCREELEQIVSGILGVMWPKHNPEEPWSPDTHGDVELAIGKDLVRAWLAEIRASRRQPTPRAKVASDRKGNSARKGARGRR